MATIPTEFRGVTAVTKANGYFEVKSGLCEYICSFLAPVT